VWNDCCSNIVWLPRLTEKGERICILSLAEVDPDVLDVGATLKVFWMICKCFR
jgi:hypothetical protein